VRSFCLRVFGSLSMCLTSALQMLVRIELPTVEQESEGRMLNTLKEIQIFSSFELI
jgi:hypothetical protein